MLPKPISFLQKKCKVYLNAFRIKYTTAVFNFIYLQLRAKTFSWFGMQDPKDEAQVSRKRDDISKEILAWRVKLRRERYSLLEFWKDIV